MTYIYTIIIYCRNLSFQAYILARHSCNQSGKDKARGVWHVSGDVLLVTRHSTHVTISKNLHKLVLVTYDKGDHRENHPS
ncbi:MAG TPA: hypothetical protein ACFYD9_07015, partial [Candidatus Wunengus sp. YC64]|uniref:hypothetical protein n=1 Tax=Candidatus Wunengus sp. YC64 TaxID=3367700 RepID=UPI0040272308